MIYAIDVGSTIAGRNGVAFAWSAVNDIGEEVLTGTCPEALSIDIARHIYSGEHVALGIEAPMFLPVPTDKVNLSRGRLNERDRSWAAPAGGYVAALGAHQCAWLLRDLRSRSEVKCQITVDPAIWLGRTSERWPVLFCWEAFVSGPAHAGHAEDARTAAMYFHVNQCELKTEVSAENPFSLFGAAVLWSGWSEELSWLERPLVVLKPKLPWVAG